MKLGSGKKPRVMAYVELVFDVAYLLVLLGIAACTLSGVKTSVTYLWVAMTLVLFLGDAFHLVPRIAFAISGNEKLLGMMGRGKQITSISMTLFYVMLWYIGATLLGNISPLQAAVVCLCALVRVVLCLLPQNGWTAGTQSGRLHIYRNIPFVLLGAFVAVFFFVHARSLPPALEWMWLAIALSFAFYIPVVLWAKKCPMLGALMLPKTCVYVWIVCMGMGV